MPDALQLLHTVPAPSSAPFKTQIDHEIRDWEQLDHEICDWENIKPITTLCINRGIGDLQIEWKSSILNFFSWQQINNQIYFQTKFEDRNNAVKTCQERSPSQTAPAQVISFREGDSRQKNETQSTLQQIRQRRGHTNVYW
jgi:hypothetical protein